MREGPIESLEQLRDFPFTRKGLEDLSSRLPDDERLDTLFAEAIERRDSSAFVPLLVSTLHARRRFDVRHLERGAMLIESSEVVIAAALLGQGDPCAPLFASIRHGGFTELQKSALLGAMALAVRDREELRLPDGFVSEARTLARRGGGAVGWNMAVVSFLVPDEGLQRIVETHSPFRREAIEARLTDWTEQITSDLPSYAVLAPRHTSSASSGAVRRAVARVGRNDPCPCGSGKKYKRCCFGSDRERLSRSSTVEGVTVDELRKNPEEYLTDEMLIRMSGHELAALDPGRVDPSLHLRLISRLTVGSEPEAMVRFFEEVGVREELVDRWYDALELAAEPGDPELVRRLWRARGEAESEDDADVSLHVRLLLAEGEDTLLDLVEEQGLEALRHGVDCRSIDFAHDLLKQRPALGILVARGVLPHYEGFERHILLEALGEARDRLELHPDDPIEPLLADTSWGDEPSSDVAELLAARETLRSQSAEVHRLREERARLEAELTKRPEPPIAVPVPTAAPEPPEAPPAEPPRDPVRDELRARLAATEGELKERHDERNRLRRELRELQKEMARVEKEPPEPTPASDDVDPEAGLLAEEEMGDEVQPVRVPIFPAKFAQTLGAVQPAVARAALKLIGRLAAGESAAFRGSRHLRRRRDVVRQKVGASHRLLFRPTADTLEVVALIHRRDLERAIRTV